MKDLQFKHQVEMDAEPEPRLADPPRHRGSPPGRDHHTAWGSESRGVASPASHEPWEADARLLEAMGLHDGPEATQEHGRARNEPLDGRMPNAGSVQMKGGGNNVDRVHATADAGISGPGGPLPFMEQIQALFGAHDVSDVRAHSTAEAAAANVSLGSTAYAKGNHIAFASAPDLHTAAHEAAHVVQQRGGVQLSGGVGQPGDAYERHADAVADQVVQKKSAESLLTAMVGAPTTGSSSTVVQHKAVQFLGARLDEKLPDDAEAPAFGEDKGVRRRYSVEQYIAMWEKEQGRKMTPVERTVIERGCIGITAHNLHDGVAANPLTYAEGTFGTFEQAHAEMKKRNALLEQMGRSRRLKGPDGKDVKSNASYVLFAQLFWSNQSPDFRARTKADPKAFLPDPETGKIDMSSYHYEARMKEDGDSYVNFDFGFWDEASQSFWHANHKRYKEPEKNAKKPMEVYQSTKERFIAGYKDFDRAVFCIARAENYDPKRAATTHKRGHR